MATLSSKGQVLLPKEASVQLRLRAGDKFTCKLEEGSIVLTPQQTSRGHPKFITDPKTGLRITRSPRGIKVTTADVRFAWGVPLGLSLSGLALI